MILRPGRAVTSVIAAAAGIFLLTLAGCKRTDASAGSTNSAAKPMRQSKVKQLEVLWSTPASFNPVGADTVTETTVLNLLHDHLVNYDPVTSKLVPGLAASYDQSADARRWTFHLRDATTPDGEKLDAQTVAFSVGLYLDKQFESSQRPNLMVGDSPLRVEIVDSRTVALVASKGTPFLPWILSGVTILPRGLYAGIAGNADSFRAALDRVADPRWLRGFGPFFVEKRTAQEILLRRNPAFWSRDENGQQLPYLSSVRFTLIDDPQVQKARFQRDRQFPCFLADPLSLQQYKDTSEWRIHDLGPDGSALFFWLNQNPLAPQISAGKLKLFRSIPFRRALAQGLRRERVIDKAVLGKGQPLLGPVSPAYSWTAAQEELHRATPAYDLEAARSQLATLGVKDTDGDGVLDYDEAGGRRPLSVYLYTTRSPGKIREIAAEEVTRQLRALGLDARFEVIEFNAAVNKIMKTFDYEAMLMFLEGSDHPATQRSMYHSSGRMHFFAPSQTAPLTPWEDRVDADIERALTAPDEQSGLKEFTQVQLDWIAAQPVFYLLTRTQQMVVRNEYDIGGFAATGRASHPMLTRPAIERLQITRSGP